MANTISLDDMFAAVNDKFSSLHIPLKDGASVELLPAMRLGAKARLALNALEPEKDEKGEIVDTFDIVEFYRDWARIVARTPEQAEKLIEAAGDTLGIWKEIQDNWSEKTQPGEASPSQN